MNWIRRLPPLFFIGLLPVVILLGLWADSIGYRTRWERWGKDSSLQVVAIAARVFVIRIDARTWEPEGHERYIYMGPHPGETAAFGRLKFREKMPGKMLSADWFPAVERNEQVIRFGGQVYEQRAQVLPFWLILVCYLPLWLGLAWWQARRRRKRIEAELTGT
ncbi:hypothetical protein [Haloferula sp. BvORR071]|uniref:hypothetical protein n=1 Tax=Haloferula sp. BvORR071 TaxID=1396141 RepID=UPI000554DF1B|nr:hypothetical protein [Haloferula sp. BvORR071]